MAQLKDLLVNGPSRFIGDVFINSLSILDTFKVGADGVYLKVDSTGIEANGPIYIPATADNTMPANTGVPWDTYSTTHGLRIYSDGIGVKGLQPANRTDAFWIRHLESTADSGQMEIAVGDNNNEEIIFRRYDMSHTIKSQVTLIDSSGNFVFGQTDTDEPQRFTLNGKMVINPSYTNTGSESYNHGLRINRTANGKAQIVLGGAQGVVSGSVIGTWTIGTISTPEAATGTPTSSKFFITHNGINTNSTLLFEGDSANTSFQFKPRLNINNKLYVGNENDNTQSPYFALYTTGTQDMPPIFDFYRTVLNAAKYRFTIQNGQFKIQSNYRLGDSVPISPETFSDLLAIHYEHGNSIFRGTITCGAQTDAITTERRVEVASKAGKIYLYSHGNTLDRGIYLNSVTVNSITYPAKHVILVRKDGAVEQTIFYGKIASTQLTSGSLNDLNGTYNKIRAEFFYAGGSNNISYNPMNGSNDAPASNAGLQFGMYSYGSATGHITQELAGYGSAAQHGKWIRWYDSSSWSSWEKFLTSINFNDYVPTLQGTGATGSWNITAAKATAANITSTKYGVAYYNNTTGTFASTSAGSSGYLLQGNSTSSAPSWIQATNANTASTVVKRDSSGNFSAGTITATLSGNASTATKFSSAKTIALTGAVTGSVSSDGTNGWSIATTLGAHTHVPSNINTGNDYTTEGLDPITAAYIGSATSNKSFNLPASAITIEYSTNGGSSWTSYGATDDQKRDLFSETRGTNFYLGKSSSASTNNVNNQLRVTIEPTDRYTSFHGIYVWLNRSGNTVVMDLERSTIGAKNTFTTVFTNQPVSGWSGNNIRYFSQGQFGGGTNQTSNTYKYRITFKTTAINSSYNSAYVQDIRFLGYNVWTSPNNMVSKNHLYNWDLNLNATFPAQLTATAFNGNATSATSAGKWTSAQTVYVTLGTASTTTTLQGGSSTAQTIGVNGTLAIGNGGTGLTSSPSMLTNLGSTTAANVLQASPRPGITGTLGLGNGGTGATTAAGARTNLELGTLATKSSLTASDIPNLSASKINDGTFNVARIPDKFLRNDGDDETIGNITIKRTDSSYPIMNILTNSSNAATAPACYLYLGSPNITSMGCRVLWNNTNKTTYFAIISNQSDANTDAFERNTNNSNNALLTINGRNGYASFAGGASFAENVTMSKNLTMTGILYAQNGLVIPTSAKANTTNGAIWIA